MTAEVVAEVIGASDLALRVKELGEAISHDYGDTRPVLLSVLVGSLPFVADLARAIKVPVDIDFLALSRFGEGGRIRIALDSSIALQDRHVLIVEDIVDTGLSLTVLRRMLADRGATSVGTVALLDKVPRRVVEVPLEYRGFEVGDGYLIGYGLDYESRFRNLPSIWAVLDGDEMARDPDRVAHLLYPGK